MNKNNWAYFVGILIVFVLISSFANMRSSNRKISKVNVSFTHEKERFLTADIVNKMLIQRKDSAFYQQKDMLALSKVEKELSALAVIKDVQLYTVPQGKLLIEITERTPIVRVVGNTSYYVDQTGSTFPLSKRYTPKVPLFYGQLDKDNMTETVHFLSAVSQDSFLSDELIHLWLKDDQYVLGMRSYPFDVVWGKNKSFAQKAKKLKRVCAYLAENPDASIRQLNLTYAQQVVARHTHGYGK